MANNIQNVGMIVSILIALVGWVFSLYRHRFTEHTNYDDAVLFEHLTRSSAASMCVLLLFVAISLLFK